MIKNIRVIHREINTWVRGNTFEGSFDTPFGVDQTMFERNYPRGTSTDKVWFDIREQMLITFFGVFYPQVVDVTKPDSKHVEKRRQEQPDLYEFLPEQRKWAMSEAGYISSVIFGRERAGQIPSVGDVDREMDIGVSENALGEPEGIDLINDLQREFRGKTHSIVLFVYPDRYDEIIRSIFELEITHWD